MAGKGSLEKVAQIRLQMGDVPVTKMMEEKIVDYIRETIKKFNAVKYNTDSIALRTTTVRFNENGKAETMYIRVSTQRVEGILRIFTFNIEK